VASISPFILKDVEGTAICERERERERERWV
jgi:hypothetical protein